MHVLRLWATFVGSVLLCAACMNESVESTPVAPHPVIATAPASALTPSVPTMPVFPTDCPGGQPKDPIEYGVCRLELAKTNARSTARARVALANDADAAAALAATGAKLDPHPESYAIVSQGDSTVVVGRDPAGAMYGALELAERLGLDGATALPIQIPVLGTPKTIVRGANPFLLLPIKGETSWWFRDPTFWVEYLDMMARGRLNFLDLHGMANFYNTGFPNILLFFATSSSFPDVGEPRAERETNLAMLRGIVEAARVRGIRVGMLSYRADLSPLAEKDETVNELDEPQIERYTREAVEDILKRAPGLASFGFRVGESKRPPEWYTGTYIAGIHAANTGAVASTRTWRTDKKSLLTVLQASGPETLVEAKYNGEQFGPPYVIAGGHMPGWHSYSYEEYLTPPRPYRFVMQILEGATNRVFRYASYERTARAVRALGISPQVQGFSYEAPHAFTPQRDFYHANPADAFSPWTFRRDELGYFLFGRLGYDPSTPDRVFRGMLAERVGTTGLWDAVQAGSDIVQWIQTALTCGPDQRDYAPELELGGTVEYWSTPVHPLPGALPSGTTCPKGHFAFDSFAVAMPYEAAEDLVQGRGTSRLSPVDVAQIVLADARVARAASQVKIDPANIEARDYVREAVALADLGDWFGHKLRSATALAVYKSSGADEWVSVAKAEVETADSAFRQLANDTAYIAPFDELMRMRKLGKPHFHWRDEVPMLAEDPESIDKVVQEVRAHPPKPVPPLPHAKAWLDAARGKGPGLSQLSITPTDPAAPNWTVAVTLASPPPPGAHISVLHRPFHSNGPDWASVPATGSGTAWKASVPGTGAGAMFAVEITGRQGQSFRYPDVRQETPYRVIAP
jgi:hypothetical protein